MPLIPPGRTEAYTIKAQTGDGGGGSGSVSVKGSYTGDQSHIIAEVSKWAGKKAGQKMRSIV